MISDEFSYNQPDEPDGKNYAGLRKVSDGSKFF